MNTSPFLPDVPEGGDHDLCEFPELVFTELDLEDLIKLEACRCQRCRQELNHLPISWFPGD
jgi:hypothetical protein